MASPLLILSAVLSLLALSATADNNFLLTGDILSTDSVLSDDDNVFVMQGDCNLVLYNNRGGFQSNTHGKGVNCTLTLSDHGQLVIKNGDGSVVWNSPNTKSEQGRYAAVLRPDGQVVIYGPMALRIPETYYQPIRKVPTLRNTPLVNNLLFSSQILYANGMLRSRDYRLIMNDDCNLVLRKASRTLWQSNTKGNGQHCFLRLNHRGQIAVIDDEYNVLSRVGDGSKEGEYVLILQPNGQVGVYGPAIFSTASGSLSDAKIAMLTQV